MNEYVTSLMAEVKAKNPAEPEFHQAVQEVAESLALVLDRHPEYRHAKVLERIIEPERPFAVRPSIRARTCWTFRSEIFLVPSAGTTWRRRRCS